MANLYRTWGIPEYLRIREELRNASIGPGYSIRLLERLSMVTYKMKNLAGVLSTADGEDTVLQRMEMLDLARNLLNMVIIDADGEDVGVQSLSVAGVKDILDNACAMLSAVSHIPQTRLFGRSPAGENATGESDLENYKEFVGGLQNGDLRDNTRTIARRTSSASTIPFVTYVPAVCALVSCAAAAAWSCAAFSSSDGLHALL